MEAIKLNNENNIIKIELDENSYLTGNWATIGGDETWTSVEALPETTNDIKKLQCYKYENNEFVFDEEKYTNFVEKITKEKEKNNTLTEIKQLKNELESNDYKIIKLSEITAKFISDNYNVELPYNIEELYQERQNIRNRINELEKSI